MPERRPRALAGVLGHSTDRLRWGYDATFPTTVAATQRHRAVDEMTAVTSDAHPMSTIANVVEPNASPELLRRRPELAQILHTLDIDGLIAVVVFGSVARNTATHSSDLDTLVVVESKEDRARALEALRELPDKAHLPMVFTSDVIRDQTRARPSFILHLLDEGVDLYSTAEWAALRSDLGHAASQPDALEQELRNRSRALGLFRESERYSSSPITALSHLYALGRSVVIVKLLQRGIHEFDWHELFDSYAKVRPDLVDELNAVQDLRPFYEFARDRSATRPMIDGRGDEVVRRMARAVEQIAA